MIKPLRRPATVAALVNGLVVYLLPLTFASVAALLTDGNSGARVVGVDPDRAYIWSRRLWSVGLYFIGVAPFAFAAGWRTFVHARRRLEHGLSGAMGIAEGGLCGLLGAVLVLLPGIVTRPTQAPPYVLAYGGLAAALGLTVGTLLWVTAILALHLYPREGSPPFRRAWPRPSGR